MSQRTRILSRIAVASLITAAIAAGCAGNSDEDNYGDTDGSTGAGNNAAVGGGFATSGAGGDGGSAPTTGSGGEDPFNCGDDVSEASLEKLPADLIIAVDNSDSMALEASEVKAHMNTLVGALTATNIDAHVIVISKGSNNTIFSMFETGVCLPAPLGSGSCPNDENLPNYRRVDAEVGSNDALQKIIDTYDDYKAQLRPNASKTFLVVSDDESDMSAAQFQTALANLNPPITNYKFNAIVASSEGLVSCGLCAIQGCSSCSNPCCDKSLACLPISQEKGQEYMSLQSQSGGIYGDLCTQSFAPVFADMATAVIQHTQISCQFDIPDPSNGTLIPGETNVDYVPNNQATPQPIYNVASSADCTINGGWYFDNPSNPSQIHLCPSTCTLVKESTEGKVRVKYGCKTQTLPN